MATVSEVYMVEISSPEPLFSCWPPSHCVQEVQQSNKDTTVQNSYLEHRRDLSSIPDPPPTHHLLLCPCPCPSSAMTVTVSCPVSRVTRGILSHSPPIVASSRPQSPTQCVLHRGVQITSVCPPTAAICIAISILAVYLLYSLHSMF